MTEPKTAFTPTLEVVDRSWQLCRIDERESIAVPAQFSSEPKAAPVSVHLRIHQLDEPIRDFATRLMRRRVLGAELPKERAARIGDRPSLTFDWTDGVLNLETEFVDTGAGTGLEINYGFDPHLEGAPSTDRVRERLSEHVAVSWEPERTRARDEQADKRKQSLYFPEAMLEEIKEQAQRLDRSLSWVVQRAWKTARREIKELPGTGTENERDTTPQDDLSGEERHVGAIAAPVAGRSRAMR